MMTGSTTIAGVQGTTQSTVQNSNSQTQVQSSSQVQSNIGKQSTHSKTQNTSYGYEYVNSGISSPYTSTVGTIPVVVQPTTVSGSPTQYYAIPTSQGVYQGPQYLIDGSSQFGSGTQFLAVPTMLSPTLVATSPQMNATYASYGFVPSQQFAYTAVGASSPVNSSRPNKYSTGCC